MKTFIFGLATLAMAISTVSVPPAFAQAPAPTTVPAPQQSFEAGLYDQSLQQIAEARTRGEAGPTEAFLAAHPGWRATRPVLPLGRPRGEGIRLDPFHDETDGFFIARLEKP